MVDTEREIASEVQQLHEEGRQYTEDPPPVRDFTKLFQSISKRRDTDDELMEERIY